MNPIVYFEFGVGRQSIGRVQIKLFEGVAPKTVKNFIELVKSKYENSIVHRIIPGFMVQMGDFTRGDGTGGHSIYGKTFPDENFELKHDQYGTVAMANSGPDTNGSQFYITFAETHWLNNKHVVFGKVIDGMDVLKQLERCGSEDGRPQYNIKIISCGMI